MHGHLLQTSPPSAAQVPGIDQIVTGSRSDDTDAARCLRHRFVWSARGPTFRSQRGVRVGATSSCRRPSLAASTGHEANLNVHEISNKNFRITLTTERVALLKNCFHPRLSLKQIAHEIGVSRN